MGRQRWIKRMYKKETTPKSHNFCQFWWDTSLEGKCCVQDLLLNLGVIYRLLSLVYSFLFLVFHTVTRVCIYRQILFISTMILLPNSNAVLQDLVYSKLDRFAILLDNPFCSCFVNVMSAFVIAFVGHALNLA